MIWRVCMLAMMFLGACTAVEAPPRIAFAALDFDRADAGSGEKLFFQSHNEAPTCSSCHVAVGEGGGLGNSLAGLADAAGERAPGLSAEEYLYWSIVRPARHLVAGYSNVMYARYEESFGAEDLADVIAYLLTLNE